jgi:cytosine/uracil/thiamine/allantoin permease
MTHLFVGVLLAMIISYVFYLKAPQEITQFQKINIIVLILLLLPMVVYKLLPKSDYMLKHPQKDQDYKDWFNIYLCMKNKSLYGFLCGFTVSIVILSLMGVE